MIIDFSVENFGSIKTKQTFSFEATDSHDLEDYYVFSPEEKYPRKEKLRLLKLGIIYGANASGKSTILQALSFLKGFVGNPAKNKNDILLFDPFLFDPETPTKPSKLSIRFINEGIRFEYEVAFNHLAIIAESLHFFAPNRALVYDRNTNMDKQFAAIKFGDKIKISKTDQAILSGNTLWNDTVLAGFNKTNIDNDIIKNTYNWFQHCIFYHMKPTTNLIDFFSKNIKEGSTNHKNVIRFMKEADFNVDEIVINEKKPQINMLVSLTSNTGDADKKKPELELMLRHIVNGQIYDLSMQKESDGSQRYFQLAGFIDLLIRAESAAAIDEFESSLHPDLVRHFLLTYLQQAKHSQLLLTTHYRELLDDRSLFRDDAIWFTDKGEDAATRLYSLADFSTDTIRKTSSVYNAYKTGKLGAVPNL